MTPLYLTDMTGLPRNPLLLSHNTSFRNTRNKSPNRHGRHTNLHPSLITLLRVPPPLQIIHHTSAKTRLPRPPSRPPPHLPSPTLRPNLLSPKRTRITPRPSPQHRP